jgi:hypothetical protein
MLPLDSTHGIAQLLKLHLEFGTCMYLWSLGHAWTVTQLLGWGETLYTHTAMQKHGHASSSTVIETLHSFNSR